MALKLPLEELQRVQEVLNKIELMRPLGLDEVREMAFQLTRRSFKRDDVIIKQGSEGRHFFFIYRGRVKVIKEKMFGKVELAELGPGDFFGEMSLIDGTRRSATVVGHEPGEMYTLPHDAFRAVLMANNSVRQMILDVHEARKRGSIGRG